MKRSRQELKVDGAVELPHVISYLEQLVQALKAGMVRVHRGDEQVILGPRGVIGFSLAAAEKGKRQRLSLELTWRKYDAPDADLDLVIGSVTELPPAAEEVAASEAVAAEAEVEKDAPPVEAPAASAHREAAVPGEVVLGEPE